MNGAAFHLAWRYVTRHRLQTLLLACALGLVLALPMSMRVLVDAAEAAMRSRASQTPQVIGARGSALDLLLTALYFKRQPLPTIPASTLDDVRHSGQGQAIPVYVRFHAQGAPIVGTELEYFDFRGLTIGQGRMMTKLGDAVIGARLAAQRGLKAGASVFSSQEQVFDLAGIYPLKMRVTGILNANGTPDDDAVFVDLKTAWLIQGLAHGHDDVVKTPDAVLTQEKGNAVANASVRMFNEVTDANLAGFHFHGDMSQYPVSAVIVLPKDDKAEAMLAGHYLKSDSPAQLIRPRDEFDALMKTLFQAENLALGVLGLTAAAAFAVAALVFALSFRLRQREFGTLEDVGVSRIALSLTKLLEVAMVGAAGVLIALGLTLIVDVNASAMVRLLLLA